MMFRGMVEPVKFQSTHPSGVRLDGGNLLLADREISIHAPQWGAT